MKYTDIFTNLGLAKNEAKIYEHLLGSGQSSVSGIASGANINRRNVYDSLERLLEKGLIFQVRTGQENQYQAVPPRKLMELVKEKESSLAAVLPELEQLHGALPHTHEVFIYKGIEGWKNYMQDVIRVGEDLYSFAVRGGWLDPRIAATGDRIHTEAKNAGIKFHLLIDHEVIDAQIELPESYMHHARIMPKGYSTKASVDVFGDHVVILSGIGLGKLEDNFSITVIINQEIADGFRTWWQTLWEISAELPK